MSATEISAEALKGYIPHRGVNLIPDSVTLAGDMRSARSRTHIPQGDERGREIFSRQGSNGQVFWNEPFIAELLALTGIPLLAQQLADEGKVAVFSAISKIAAVTSVPFYDEVIGYTEITRQRPGFAQFATHLEHRGQRVFSAEIMSGSATMDAIMGKVAADQPPLPSGQSLPDWAWKPAPMRFIDRIIDTEEQQIQAGYRYPEQHPFVPGHFPDGPLMMGVTQWAAMGDAFWALLQQQAIGAGRYRAQGSITRPDGSEVVSARDLEIEVEENTPRLCGLKRIMFREVVRPGDELLVTIRQEP